jgi:HPt (histidine-containing phosphotransfer) domain-containing protein
VPASQEANGSEESLDHAVLENLRDLGDSDLLSELTQMFFEEVPDRLFALREAVDRGDGQTIQRVAHTLKGSSGNMGAKLMSRICLDLENAGESNDFSTAAGLLEALEEEFDRVRTQLTALVG